MGVITIQREDVYAVLHELIPLLKAHEGEVGHSRQLPFAPNWPLINNLIVSGNLVLFSARDDGVLIGYNLFCCARTTQHGQAVIADNELIYLKPEYRKGVSTIIELMATAEVQLMKAGVSAVRYHSVPSFKGEKGGLGKLYRFMNAKPMQITYEKALTPETAGRRRYYGRRRERKQRTAKSLYNAGGHGRMGANTGLRKTAELSPERKQSIRLASVQPSAKPH